MHLDDRENACRVYFVQYIVPRYTRSERFCTLYMYLDECPCVENALLLNICYGTVKEKGKNALLVIYKSLHFSIVRIFYSYEIGGIISK